MKKFSIFAPRNAKNGTYGAPNDCGNAVADMGKSARTNGATGKVSFSTRGAASKVSFSPLGTADKISSSTPGAAGTISSANGAARKASSSTRGATIEYAVVFMVIVTVFIALILTLGMQSAKLSDRYNAYTDEKLLLDEIGAAATSAYQGKTESEISASAPDLSALYADKLTPYGWSVEQTATAASAEELALRTVTVKKGDGVRLLVRFTEQSDGTYLLTQYTYGD